MKRTRRIALDLGQTHFLENYRMKAYRGILRYARTRGNWEILYNDHHFSLVGKYNRLCDLPRLNADGVILSCWNRKQIRELRRFNIPIVSISNDFPEEDVPTVITDDCEVGQLAARHFLERGFQSFAFCGSLAVPWDNSRWQGFQAELSHHRFSPQVFEFAHILDEGERRKIARTLCNWLHSLPKPVGIFCADDTYAFQVLEAARQKAISVPRDAAVVGVDNNFLICESAIPPLSSIEQDTDRVGYEAAALLDSILDGATPPNAPIVVSHIKMITRASSDILAVDDPLISQALEFIRDHLGEAIGIDQIARVTNVSRRTIETRFRDRLGMSVNQLVRQKRTQQAKALLLDPNLSLDEIARRTGFRTAAYFCHCFKKETGQTPNDWRKNTASRHVDSGNVHSIHQES